MACYSMSPFLPRYGYHRSCGNHSVRIAKETTLPPFPTISIHYDQMIGDKQTSHQRFLRWGGPQELPSVADVEGLLESASVPPYIRRGALSLVLECVDVILMELRNEEALSGVQPCTPSLTAYIFSHREDFSGYESLLSGEELSDESEDEVEEGVDDQDLAKSDELFEDVAINLSRTRVRRLSCRSARINGLFIGPIWGRSCLFKKLSTKKSSRRMRSSKTKRFVA